MHEPGEGPRSPDAKARARKVLDDPKHKRPKGHADDLLTVDGDLDDPHPKHNHRA